MSAAVQGKASIDLDQVVVAVPDPKDTDKVTEIVNKILEFSARIPAYSDESVASTRWLGNAQSVVSAIKSGRTAVYVASNELSKALGYCMISGGGYVVYFAVDPTYQRMGVGRKIFQEVMKDFPEMTLHVMPDNKKAQAFYRNLASDSIKVIDQGRFFTFQSLRS